MNVSDLLCLRNITRVSRLITICSDPVQCSKIRRHSEKSYQRRVRNQQISTAPKVRKNFVQSATATLKHGHQRQRKFGKTRSTSTPTPSITVTPKRAKKNFQKNNNKQFVIIIPIKKIIGCRKPKTPQTRLSGFTGNRQSI